MKTMLGIVLVAVVVLCGARCAFGAGLVGAGDGEHAWLLVEQEWAEGERWDVYHAAAVSEAGALSRVLPLTEKPLGIVADERRLVMIFPARESPSGGSLRPVRSMSVVQAGPGGMFQYQPAGRAAAEAALTGSGVLVGAEKTPDGPGVVLRETSASGSGRLEVFTGTAWEARELPAGLDANVEWVIGGVPGGMLISAGDSAWVWDDGSGWRRTGAVRGADERVFSAAGQMISASWTEDEGLVLRLLQSGREFDLATVAGVPEEHAVVGLGETAAVYWFDAEETRRLRSAVVSSISGEIVYEGFAGSAGPLKKEDLQFIALVAGSVLLIVVLFLVRPEGDLQQEPVLPEGTALAEPSARFFAAMIDVFPAAVVSSMVWGVPIWAAVSPGLAIEQSAGLSPIFLTAALYFFHSALGDWMGGRTIGKRVAGCRTVDVSGRPRLRLRQALMRNLFKAVFPPLTMLLLLDPSRRHPADQVSGTIVVSRVVEPPEDAPPG